MTMQTIISNSNTDTGHVAAHGDRTKLETLFVTMLRERWRRGAEQYRDSSFTRPLPETAEQIIEEAVDIGGWSLVLFEQVRQRLARIVDSTATLADLHARAVAAEGERDALRRQLADIRETLAAAPQCPTWAALAGLVGMAARLASSEGTT